MAMNSTRPLVRLSRLAQWMRSGQIITGHKHNFAVHTCARRLHSGLVLCHEGMDRNNTSLAAAVAAANTLCDFHPPVQSETKPDVPLAEVPQEVLQELCQLVVKDISSLESLVLVRLLRCVLCSKLYQDNFKAKMYAETRTRLENSRFTVSEVCDVIEELSTYISAPEDLLQTAWHSFGQQASRAKTADIKRAYETLSLLAPPAKGQAAVAVPYAFTQLDIAVEKRWRTLSAKDITAIARGITLGNHNNPTLILPWLSEHCLELNTTQLKEVIAMFDHFRYSSARISEIVTQYTCAKVEEMDGVVLGMVMEYFRIRAYLSKNAFDAVARQTEQIAAKLEKRDLFKILRVFGQLNYSPKNLPTLLAKLERRFWQFNGVALLELMASFVYIERYPTNFYKDLLSLHFLAETFTGNVPEKSVRHMLELRAAFTVDRPSWKPLPMPLGHLTLSKEALAFHGEVRDKLENFHLYLTQYFTPRNTPHMIDFVIHSNKQTAVMPRDPNNKEDFSVALLCMLPTHFTVNTKTLLGVHAMKIRHLNKVGFKVIQLDLTTWKKKQKNGEEEKFLKELLAPYWVL